MQKVKSVDRAVDILLSFTRARPSMDVSEMQDRLGMARPTLYRMLRTLEQKGLIRSSGEPRRYELGHKVVELANVWLSNIDVTRAAKPILEALKTETEETLALNIPLADGTRLCAIEIPSLQPLSFSVGVGHIAPLHVGASGKTILAFLADGRAEAAVRRDPELARQFEQIRDERYSVTRGELISGAMAIAAPVFDRFGAVIASISVVGPEARFKGQIRQASISLVQRAAEEISKAMGYSPSVERSGRR
ncbi:MAG TPA: IclR family transcriptional regulator [Rhodoblastus sp.]|nr:IclR family transcriptional regulator [Rhodoblastus sp.]